MIIPDLWRRLNCLVPEPQCKTFGDEYEMIQWTDSRTLPTENELLACTEADIVDAEVITEISNKLDSDKAFKLLFFLNLDQENRIRLLEGKNVIDQAVYKQALIDLYKTL